MIGVRLPVWRGTHFASPQFASLSPRQQYMRGKDSSAFSAKPARVKKLPHRWRRRGGRSAEFRVYLFHIYFSKIQKREASEANCCHAMSGNGFRRLTSGRGMRGYARRSEGQAVWAVTPTPPPGTAPQPKTIRGRTGVLPGLLPPCPPLSRSQRVHLPGASIRRRESDLPTSIPIKGVSPYDLSDSTV